MIGMIDFVFIVGSFLKIVKTRYGRVADLFPLLNAYMDEAELIRGTSQHSRALLLITRYQVIHRVHLRAPPREHLKDVGPASMVGTARACVPSSEPPCWPHILQCETRHNEAHARGTHKCFRWWVPPTENNVTTSYAQSCSVRLFRLLHAQVDGNII